MLNLQNKNVLITGATGGIGNSLVKKFLDLNATVLATGTKKEKLDQLTKQFSQIKIIDFKLDQHSNIEKFIDSKKIISVLLIPVMIVLFIIGLYNWYSIGVSTNFASSFYYVNEVFYNTFFSILIIADVFILLLSFLYTERYSQIMRNTGFIICTILIRLSFSSTGLTNLLLIISSVLFGLLILKIYSLMNKIE